MYTPLARIVDIMFEPAGFPYPSWWVEPTLACHESNFLRLLHRMCNQEVAMEQVTMDDVETNMVRSCWIQILGSSFSQVRSQWKRDSSRDTIVWLHLLLGCLMPFSTGLVWWHCGSWRGGAASVDASVSPAVQSPPPQQPCYYCYF